MYEIELTGGIVLRMPESLAEITVEQYCEFLQGVEDFVDWQNKGVEDGADVLAPGYQLERLHRLSRMVQDFCIAAPEGGLTLDQVFRLPVGDYVKSLKDTFGVGSLEEVDLDKSELTLYTLWANIYRVIARADISFEGDAVEFEWKGERYRMKPINRDRMTGLELPPDITVQEAVEVLELRRKAAALVEKKREVRKNIRWELFHRQMAIMALREGEELPVDDLEFEKFVSERAAHFIGIDAETALKVDFFLAGAFDLLSRTLTAITFSTLQDRKTSGMRRDGARSRLKIAR